MKKFLPRLILFIFCVSFNPSLVAQNSGSIAGFTLIDATSNNDLLN